MSDKPYMNPQTHRLTDLPGEKHPLICQKCGGSNRPGQGNGLMRRSIDRWREHDHNDRPENRVVVLCDKCSREIVGPHPRLYTKLQTNEPLPGCMDLCVACRWRSGVSCSHPSAKANGGAGVMITVAMPTSAFVDGCKFRGVIHVWPSPPTACKQKEEV